MADIAPAASPTKIILELHFINISGGDATAIVIRQDPEGTILKKVLIDAGGEGSCTARLNAYLDFLGGPAFDLVVSSHYHKDHCDGFYNCDIKFKNTVDIGGYKLGEAEVPAANGPGKGLGYPFRGYARQVKENGAARKTDDYIKLLEDPLVTLRVCCTGGVLANGNNVLGGQRMSQQRPVDPNDVSVALLLEWEDGNKVFRYYTAGDLSGDLAQPPRYYNVEQPLVEYLTTTGALSDKKGVTVLKASHHGSDHSTYQPGNAEGLLDKLTPDTVVVPANIVRSVPGPLFFNRMQAYNARRAQANLPRAALVLVNDVDYSSRSDHYAALAALTAAQTWSNVVYDVEDPKKKPIRHVTNWDTAAVVVRRKSGGARFDDELPGYLQAVERMGGDYQIVFLPDKLWNGAPHPKLRARYVAADIQVAIEAWAAEGIDAGFAKAASAIARWWTRDTELEQTLGAAYTDIWFPSLADVREKTPSAGWVNALKAAMKELFDGYYQLSEDRTVWYRRPDEIPKGGGVAQEDLNKLDLDQRQTLYWLIMDNRWQPGVNLSWNPKWAEWNPPGEDPYPPKQASEPEDSSELPPAKRRRSSRKPDQVIPPS